MLMPVPPVFFDGALNMAQSFFSCDCDLSTLAAAFSGRNNCQAGKGKGTINAMLRTKRARATISFSNYLCAFGKNGGGTRHIKLL